MSCPKTAAATTTKQQHQQQQHVAPCHICMTFF